MSNTENRQADTQRDAKRSAQRDATGDPKQDSAQGSATTAQQKAGAEKSAQSRKAGGKGHEAASAHHDNGRESSHGDSPVDMVPKEVSPDDAAWRDRTERKLCSDDEDERQEALTDEAIDLTFPASDPPAIPTPRDDAKARARHGNPSR